MTSLRGLPAAGIRACRRAFTHFLSLSYFMRSMTGRLAPPSSIPLLLSLIHSEQRNAYFTAGAPFLKFSAPDRCF